MREFLPGSLGSAEAAGLVVPSRGIPSYQDVDVIGIAQEHHFSEWFGTTGLANRFLSIGIVGLVMSLVTTLIVATITNRFVRDKPRLADKKIKQILSAGKPLDRAAVMTLLQHPAVLELVDQPGFLAEASRVLEQTDVFE